MNNQVYQYIYISVLLVVRIFQNSTHESHKLLIMSLVRLTPANHFE